MDDLLGNVPTDDERWVEEKHDRGGVDDANRDVRVEAEDDEANVLPAEGQKSQAEVRDDVHQEDRRPSTFQLLLKLSRLFRRLQGATICLYDKILSCQWQTGTLSLNHQSKSVPLSSSLAVGEV